MLSSPPRCTRSKQCNGAPPLPFANRLFPKCAFLPPTVRIQKWAFFVVWCRAHCWSLFPSNPIIPKNCWNTARSIFTQTYSEFLSLKVQPLACMLFDYSVILFYYKNENWHLTVNIIRYIYFHNIPLESEHRNFHPKLASMWRSEWCVFTDVLTSRWGNIVGRPTFGKRAMMHQVPPPHSAFHQILMQELKWVTRLSFCVMP